MMKSINIVVLLILLSAYSMAIYGLGVAAAEAETIVECIHRVTQ